MLTWNFPVIVNGKWSRAKITCKHGNKYEALALYTEQQAANGVKIQGHDMSQAWSDWA
jgi:hypothetical protein